MLTYPNDITSATQYRVNNRPYDDLRSDVAVVAIKNGEHNGIDYFAYSRAKARLQGTRFPLTDIPTRIKSALGTGDNHAGRTVTNKH